MTDYAKKTVADLTEILKSRGLPHTGKKADLVARLTEADKTTASTTDPEPTIAPTHSEPPPAAEIPPPSLTSTAEPTAPAPPAPLTETHQPAVPDDTPATATAPTYTLNLPTSTIDSELAKRQARAARFGTTTTTDSSSLATETTDNEATRALERAKRFGTTSSENSAMGKLDAALPMRRERGAGRRRGGREDRARQGSAGPVGVVKRQQAKQQQPAYVSERDRAAAEARRKKFGG